MIERTLSRAYTAIDATKDFNEQEFGKHATILGGLENTLEALSQDANNVQAIQNAGILTMSNSNFYMAQDNPSMIAKYGASEAFTEGNPALTQYSINHAKNLYEMLNNKEEKDELLNKSQIRKLKDTQVKGDDGQINEKASEINNEYNHFADLMGLTQYMGAIKNEVDQSKVKNAKIQFVASQAQYSPNWVQAMTKNFGLNEKYISSIFEEYSVDATNDLAKIVLDKDGKKNFSKTSKFSDINFKLHNESEEKDLEYFTTLKDQAYNALQRKTSA